MIVPYTVKGMGSAHYPGPPYSYASFDVLVFEKTEDDRQMLLAQLLRYDGQWPIEKLRGSADLSLDTLELALEFFSRGSGGRAGAWKPYPLNGTYRLKYDECGDSPSVESVSPPPGKPED